MALPPEFQQIRLELAREPGYPEGSRQIGYEFVAPLDKEQRLDPDLWKKNRDRCRVRRFHEGEDDAIGRLSRRPGGSWYFDYEEGIEDDETGHRLGDERFTPGEYVSIADDKQHMHTYRVVTVRPL